MNTSMKHDEKCEPSFKLTRAKTNIMLITDDEAKNERKLVEAYIYIMSCVILPHTIECILISTVSCSACIHVCALRIKLFARRPPLPFYSLFVLLCTRIFPIKSKYMYISSLMQVRDRTILTECLPKA